MHCENIDYFPKEEYSPDPNDSTMAIPYAVKRASVFIFSSCLTLLFGYFLCVLGTLCRRRPVISFASGVAFILSGLLILTGMVIYISTFKSEVGNKLRPKSSFQGPMFRYHYGYSFILAVCGLMMCELAGTFTVFLFIKWHKVDMLKKQRHHHHHLRHHSLPHHQHHKYSDLDDHLPCRRHRGRRCSKTSDTNPTDRGGGGRRQSHPIPLSESMRDLAFYNFPPVSRDTTCNTVSTSADINREYSSREFSFEILRRTTPV
nr:voltage-dependent calcium channel gamma-7 subunit-like [Parasteatoda tepidariorum]